MRKIRRHFLFSGFEVCKSFSEQVEDFCEKTLQNERW